MSALDRVLAHPDIERLARALARRPGIRLALPEPRRRAAVALVLRVDDDGELALLMIKRATFAGDPWSGHVALPGGRQEPGDLSLEATAIREAREETAVDLRTHGRILGSLDELHPRTPVLPPIAIAPFAFAFAGEADLAPSDEVASAFWVPLAALRDPAASREVELEIAGQPRRVPGVRYGEHTIWGLTERVLRELFDRWDVGDGTRR